MGFLVGQAMKETKGKANPQMLNEMFLEELKKYKHIHMLGIGGTSMSGIATILKKWGFYVTGSDANESELVDKLKNNGISDCDWS